MANWNKKMHFPGAQAPYHVSSAGGSYPHVPPQPEVRPFGHPRQRSYSTPSVPQALQGQVAHRGGAKLVKRADNREEILFYDRNHPYYSFTNFSPDTVTYRSKVYPTSEHLFQAMKFMHHRPGLAEHIRTNSKYPRDAFTEAQRLKPEVRPDWIDVRIQVMEMVLMLKFTQHPHLRKELLGTRDAYLIEDSPVDSYWGIGADKRGQNQLGKALMKTRRELQQQGS